MRSGAIRRAQHLDGSDGCAAGEISSEFGELYRPVGAKFSVRQFGGPVGPVFPHAHESDLADSSRVKLPTGIVTLAKGEAQTYRRHPQTNSGKPWKGSERTRRPC